MCCVAPTAGVPIRYRRKNGIVFIQGSLGISNKIASTSQTLFTLPTGFRTTSGYFYTTNTGTGYVMSRYLINTAGEVNIEWVRRITDGVELTGAISWMCIDACYPVD